MRYILCSDRDGRLDILKVYLSLDKALKKLKYYAKKEKCMLRIVPLPEINVGCRIYHKDGTYYGFIAHETNTLWGISERDKKDAMPNPYSKKRIDQWIIAWEFVILDEEEFTEVDQMVNMIGDINSEVEEILGEFEYINTEQVALF